MARSGWHLDSLDELAAGFDDTTGDRLDAVLRGLIESISVVVTDMPPISERSEDSNTQQPRASQLTDLQVSASRNAVVLGTFLTPRRAATLLWLRDLADGTVPAGVDIRVLSTEVLLTAGLLGWDELLISLQSDEEYGSAVAIALARREGNLAKAPEPTEVQLTELWCWLEARWSSQSDSFEGGIVSDGQHVRDWRNGIIAELQTRANPQALAST